MKRPVFILGTRPEVIKLALLVRALKVKDLRPLIISTGQHRDLLPQAFAAFDISPDIDLELINNTESPIAFVNLIGQALLKHINPTTDAYIIVQGDTASARAGAQLGQTLNIPVGHVEAGVRSHNIDEPWPEERFRKEIAKIATHHFAPTETNRENLLQENVNAASIFVTGNTVIDAIDYKSIAPQPRQDKTILLSVHRRENITTFSSEMETLLRKIADRFNDYTFQVIEHPNPDAQQLLRKAFEKSQNIVWVKPMSYGKIIQTLQQVSLVITDSGGFQEEAAELQTPIVVLREYTDRPESIGRGAFLAKRDLDTCVKAIQSAIKYCPESTNPFGPAGASDKIANFIQSYLKETA